MNADYNIAVIASMTREDLWQTILYIILTRKYTYPKLGRDALAWDYYLDHGH